MYNNINGYATKKGSLEKIVKSLDPDIIALCETKKGGQTPKNELSAYYIVERNLKQGKEGLMVCVRKGTFITAKDITETELKNLLTARIVYPRINVRVIVVHAPQETDYHETRLEFFEELSVRIICL